jgi:uncharacterized repeat protein (TIGR01451 family)
MATAFASRADARTESFTGLASSPAPLTALTSDPATGLIYAQENEGTKFFRYDPRTNAWTELAPAPVDSGNNGGSALLNGKIYVVYTSNSLMAVYDIGSDSWTTVESPITEGTADITATNGRLYLALDLEFVSLDPASGNITNLAAPPKFEAAECDEGFEPWGGLQPDGGKIYGHQGNGCTGFAVYDIGANSWQELPLVPKTQPFENPDPEDAEGAVLGSVINPLTNTYLTTGPYFGKTLYRYDIEAGSWTTGTLPFEVEDNGMVYLSLPGYEGVYLIQGEEGTGFTRYNERNQTDLVPSLTARVAKGGNITYSIQIQNGGPERAGGVVLSDQLPAKSKLVSVTTTQGACATGPTLSCDLGLLRSGTSAALTVQVKAPFKKVTNAVTVSSQATDTNAGNDSAISVTKQCVVPKLKKRSLKRAKKALRKANCKPGKVSRRFSGKIKEDKVVRSGKGARKVLPAGSKIKLVVSRGPKDE